MVHSTVQLKFASLWIYGKTVKEWRISLFSIYKISHQENIVWKNSPNIIHSSSPGIFLWLYSRFGYLVYKILIFIGKSEIVLEDYLKKWKIKLLKMRNIDTR